jgi:Glycosyl hydrolase family 12
MLSLGRTFTAMTAAAAVVFGSLAAADAVTGTMGGSSSVSGSTRVLCQPNQHMIAHTRVKLVNTGKLRMQPKRRHRYQVVYGGTRYQVRNNYWDGQRPQCLANRHGLTNFKVVQRAGFDPAGHVVAFPDILRGCIYHICSPHSRMPMKVSRIGNPRLTWRLKPNSAPGTWNAAFDIWFTRHRQIGGQSTGAELMIWLDYHGGCCALQKGAPKVRIDGKKMWFSHWVTGHAGQSWNYIQFRLTHRVHHVNNLSLRPFLRLIIRKGLVKRRWWLENIEAGFEIWNGGQGLQTLKYQVQM